MTIAGGIDVGAGAVKAAVVRCEPGAAPELLATHTERLRRRDPKAVVEETWAAALLHSGVRADQIDYLASTGEGELVDHRTGHFYSMTTHARGAIYLEPEARAVLDCGALHGRAIAIDDKGKVLKYKMTSQCASGSGQFLENIARYLGIAQDEIGMLSRQSDNPEVVSSICAVLAETDVINMVSRGISTPNILKGIHQSMAARLAKLLKATGATSGIVMVTGGLALDTGLMAAIGEEVAAMKDMKATVRFHPDSIYAGAIGAALWGAYRYEKLRARGDIGRAA